MLKIYIRPKAVSMGDTITTSGEETMEYVIDCDGWNPDKFQEALSLIGSAVNVKIVVQTDNHQRAQPEFLEKQVGDVLNRLGVPRHLIGYGYLKYSVVRCICHPEEMEGITKILYPRIAGKYHTTAGKVEHGIRHAIKRAWETAISEEWEEIFGKAYHGMGKPTNSQFIAAVSDYVTINN